MDSSSRERPAPTLLFVGGLTLALSLAVLGWFQGSAVVAAAALHWLLFSALAAGALARAGTLLSSGRALSVARAGAALLVLGATFGAQAVLRLGLFTPEAAAPFFEQRGALLLGSALLSVGAAELCQVLHRRHVPDAEGLGRTGRLGVWLGLAGAASVFAPTETLPALDGPVALGMLALTSLLAAELLLRGLTGAFQTPSSDAPFGADLIVGRFLGSSYRPGRSVAIAIETTFQVDLAHSWSLAFLRRVALPVLAGFGLFAWTLSGVVVVDASQLAVRERFGKVQPGVVLEPGLVVGLPWPLDQIRRVDVHRTRSAPLGYTDAKAGADALWTQFHAAEEYNLLLGNGRDLVTVNAEVSYRITDIHAWLYSCQNPEEALQTLAYRALMEATVDKTLDAVLSRDIATFSRTLQDEIQSQAEDKNLGVEVVAFNLRGLHPPVAVAADYQAVVAAQLDRTTFIIEAESYREVALPMAKAFALSETRDAEAARLPRVAAATGEALAFSTLAAQYRLNPDLYRFRKRLETFEDLLREEPHHVIDSRIERDGGAIWILK